MYKFALLAVLLLTLNPLNARAWRDITGKNSFQADYISNDGKLVTLRRGGRILTFSMKKLHADDQKWLRVNHPPARLAAVGGRAAKAPEGAAFDKLEFGDSRKEVLKKLNESEMVDGSVAEVMLARVGLNGVYRTKETIGGLHCHLYFDWNSNDRLSEVTLRTKPLARPAYGDQLKRNWSELIELLTMLHGKPAQNAEYPKSDDLQDGLILSSHLWHTDQGHSVLLGTGQDGANFSVVVRITSQHIKPNVVQ